MEDIHSILKQYWGYDNFRPPQEEIIQSILQQNDTIALLPTGGGKSVCFQVPALILPGKTLVISPLIALMQDQVDNLFAKGIIAKSLNANMHYKEMETILNNFVLGDLKMLYISPERIDSEAFISKIQNAKISLIAVDEAHCISQWGYDFRPSYFNINKLRDVFQAAPIIALTATATPHVLKDIAEKLHLKKPAIFKKSFARSNLSLTVLHTEDKIGELKQILDRVKGCGIIYVRNRKETIEIAQWLQHYGIPCASYHGGMEKGVRDKNQQLWMNNQARLIVSTNAFGMGIDKPDVRLVVHLDLAPSIEEYYQEAGRAGRDGRESFAVSILSSVDFLTAQANFADQFPSIEIISSVYDRLCRYHRVAYGSGMMESYDFDIISFATYLNIPVKKVFHILNILEKDGWIAFSDAYKEPSKVHFIADHTDLYHLDKVQNFSAALMVHLLRKYEGLFVDFVKIDEKRIAQDLRQEEGKIKHTLHKLKIDGFIDYTPKAAAPQIIFTRERPHEEHFTIDKKAYQQRKKMAQTRLNAMIQYLQNETICRQKIIMDYFGEKGTSCGKCDICLGVNEQTFNAEQVEKIKKHIYNTLSISNINIKQYANIYPFNQRKRIIHFIKDLEAEGYIRLDNQGNMSVP